MPAKASSSDCLLTGFFRKAKAPSFMPALPAVVDRDDVDGDVAGAGSCLRRSRTTQPSMSGRRRSSVMAAGWSSCASSRAASPYEVVTALKPISCALSTQDAGEPGLVLDDQEDPVAGLDRVAVVAADLGLGGTAGEPPRGDGRSARARRGPARGARPSAAGGRAADGHVVQRQVEGEGAPLAERALDPDLAAEQPGDLAADRQAQARAAVLPAGPRVGLLERLEDDPQLVRRDADPRVGHREGHDARRPG